MSQATTESQMQITAKHPERYGSGHSPASKHHRTHSYHFITMQHFPNRAEFTLTSFLHDAASVRLTNLLKRPMLGRGLDNVTSPSTGITLQRWFHGTTTYGLRGSRSGAVRILASQVLAFVLFTAVVGTSRSVRWRWFGRWIRRRLSAQAKIAADLCTTQQQQQKISQNTFTLPLTTRPTNWNTYTVTNEYRLTRTRAESTIHGLWSRCNAPAAAVHSFTQ